MNEILEAVALTGKIFIGVPLSLIAIYLVFRIASAAVYHSKNESIKNLIVLKNSLESTIHSQRVKENDKT